VIRKRRHWSAATESSTGPAFRASFPAPVCCSVWQPRQWLLVDRARRRSDQNDPSSTSRRRRASAGRHSCHRRRGDTVTPRVSATDRKVGRGAAAEGNRSESAGGKLLTPEDSRTRPFRQTIRRNANRMRPDAELKKRATVSSRSPSKRAFRNAALTHRRAPTRIPRRATEPSPD
jgi:hypothetical protein